MSCTFDHGEAFRRTKILLGENEVDTLRDRKVILFGVGGVGGHAAEALARSGIGHITLVDNDDVAMSNLNRQAVARVSTIGRAKVEVMKDIIADINPECEVTAIRSFLLPENVGDFRLEDYDYILDAIDTISAKICLAVQAQEKDIPIISAMGAGNKLDPTAFRVADIYKTNVCPLAKVMRRELKKRNIKHLKVVYSEEEVKRRGGTEPTEEIIKQGSRPAPGSCSFVPSVVGLIMAGEVIKDMTKGLQ